MRDPALAEGEEMTPKLDKMIAAMKEKHFQLTNEDMNKPNAGLTNSASLPCSVDVLTFGTGTIR